ncbi:hypothetical protein CNMCM8980_009372 [Aspergillus fumigatiaffinis]|uniref:Uncharacterized protein n=1 Tax=Aspergillus fumigatiaffinis TaxID=340414 RepID=A0A8H4M884_9EURO|nr:hypothetical protein CNMCM5878_003057 [Aspergillus fumigatiaffinis]KAF4224225.1 hypothetical protein CNMCM6457_009650 [Aspergillus fumigatiaffinis]KAF4232694.1 hypothetical protein CNMCM6805_009717 [Aspergillus fumigatiaffinis]KAF4245788.1 hypothetical protein CNMCM8980_009372 [Aspergillus fumigatiaffinis]
MKFTALLCTLMAATAVSASTVPRDEFQIQDTCGAGYGGDQRRLVWSSAGVVNGQRSKTVVLPHATVPMMAQPGARMITIGLEWYVTNLPQGLLDQH